MTSMMSSRFLQILEIDVSSNGWQEFLGKPCISGCRWLLRRTKPENEFLFIVVICSSSWGRIN